LDPETFFAALDAGADAVYIGLKKFSARARAGNFSEKELGKLVPYSHSLGRRVYVALNTIVKEVEIPPVIDLLSAISALKVDGVIIQDLGIYRLISKYFPSLNLHASTQMAVHNSAGVLQLEGMGFKRVVLAREMTLEEIRSVKRKSSLEVETFVHGSMCFCYAGSCFFSSYLGARSSNRGACTQPCRREYSVKNRGVSPFSMADLMSIDILPQMIEAGIDSFKIEGRMKSVEYVEAVVKSYRMVLDAAPENIEDVTGEAKKLLTASMGRKGTMGFYMTDNPNEVTIPEKSGNTGRFVGKVIKVRGDLATVRTSTALHVRDRLRVQSLKSGSRTSCSLSSILLNGESLKEVGKSKVVEIKLRTPARSGDMVFKTASHLQRGENIRAKRRLDALPATNAGKSAIKQSAIVRSEYSNYRYENLSAKSHGKMAVRVSDLKAAYGVTNNFDVAIITLSRAVIHSLRSNIKRLRGIKDRLCWSLPLIICEDDLSMYTDLIDWLISEGFRRWQVSNISHLKLLGSYEVEIWSSEYLHALNSLSVKVLNESGCSRVMISIESDMDNLEELKKKGVDAIGEIMLYSCIPLYVSRVKINRKMHGEYESDDGRLYRIKQKDSLSLLYPSEPFSLFHYLKRFRKLGYKQFQVDLSGETLKGDNYRDVLSMLRTGNSPLKSSRLNMEVGLT